MNKFYTYCFLLLTPLLLPTTLWAKEAKGANDPLLSTQNFVGREITHPSPKANDPHLNNKRWPASYQAAASYFKQRERPKRHFLNLGIGANIIESLYPFQTTAYPFFAYLNYRKEKWGTMKLPIMFSLQYDPLLKQWNRARWTLLAGLRYPSSHDLKLFHIDFQTGVSAPLNFDFEIEQPALELRLLFTHIIGPKDSRHRFYTQWGPKAKLNKQGFKAGFVFHIGIDNHL